MSIFYPTSSALHTIIDSHISKNPDATTSTLSIILSELHYVWFRFVLLSSFLLKDWMLSQQYLVIVRLLKCLIFYCYSCCSTPHMYSLRIHIRNIHFLFILFLFNEQSQGSILVYFYSFHSSYFVIILYTVSNCIKIRHFVIRSTLFFSITKETCTTQQTMRTHIQSLFLFVRVFFRLFVLRFVDFRLNEEGVCIYSVECFVDVTTLHATLLFICCCCCSSF